MSDFLAQMAETSGARVRAARAEQPEPRMLERARQSPAPLPLRLDGFDLIAELKLRSPAAGNLASQSFEPAPQLDAYAEAGAAAVSVLTEPLQFKGSLDHLEAAAARLRPRDCPVMRKDFLVDEYQVMEARAAGASGVLLIAAMLPPARLAELIAAAVELELFILLEAFDRDDLERIAAVDLPGTADNILIGINSRNLKTLEVDFERFGLLAGDLPPGRVAVAESGIESVEDIATVARLGYRMALVGSALMRDSDPGRAAQRLIAAGRRAAAQATPCS